MRISDWSSDVCSSDLGVAGRFFGMTFQEADAFNAIHGNQFIADLMPKHPIYTAMLPESARAVIGMPHPNGRAAMRMLEKEGFQQGDYVDIFDGGPTMVVQTDQVRSLSDAEDVQLAGAHREKGEKVLVASGRSEEHTSELQSLMRISYAVFCLKKKKIIHVTQI